LTNFINRRKLKSGEITGFNGPIVNCKKCKQFTNQSVMVYQKAQPESKELSFTAFFSPVHFLHRCSKHQALAWANDGCFGTHLKARHWTW